MEQQHRNFGPAFGKSHTMFQKTSVAEPVKFCAAPAPAPNHFPQLQQV
jgi:hypothetical protein